MNETPPASIHDLQSQAQADATRMWGEGPVKVWAADRENPVPWLLPVLLGAAAVWFAGRALMPLLAESIPSLPALPSLDMPGPAQHVADEDDTRLSDDPADRRAETSAGDTIVYAPEADDDLSEPQPASSSTPAATPLATQLTTTPRDAGPSSLSVERVRQGWRVDAVSASRLDAAQRLAALSGTTVHGPAELLGTLRPLDLQWESRSLARTWHALLGNHLNYILHCPGQRCEVWVLNAGPAPRDADHDAAPRDLPGDRDLTAVATARAMRWRR